MRKRKGYRLAFCTTVALSLCACSPVPEVWLFNHTESKLGVHPKGRDSCQLQPGQRCVFDYPETETLRLTNGDAEIEYTFPNGLRYESSPEYVDLKGRRTIKLQVEPDLGIWILPATAQAVRGVPARQRTGFPMRPLSAG